MTIKTIDCVECGESVPYGRLSCPVCGSLLASVARAHRSVIRVVEAAVEAEPVEPAPATMEAAVVVEPVVAPLIAPSVTESAPPTPWAPFAEPEPMLTARPYQRHLARETDPAAHPAPPPSAYRPPTLALSAAAATAGPSWLSAPPDAVAGYAGSASDTTDMSTSTRDLVDAARFVEIADWFVIVGAMMSVLGFLLPWSMSVIGSSGSGGYFNAWGLASPTHLFVLIGLLAVLALGVLRTPVPAWFRSGVLGLALGGLLIGLTWPYLVGPLGADVGVTVTALGGLALVIGGAVASWATRHAETDPPV